MPIYEYICTGCGKKHEEMQKLSDKPLRKCPKCGALKLKKALSLSGFQLKGGGWYKDGYSSSSTSSTKTSSGSDSKKTETKAETKAETKKEAKSST